MSRVDSSRQTASIAARVVSSPTGAMRPHAPRARKADGRQRPAAVTRAAQNSAIWRISTLPSQPGQLSRWICMSRRPSSTASSRERTSMTA